VILFHLFGGKVDALLRPGTSDTNITQKMLGQQLRSLAVDGIVVRTSYSSGAAEGEYRLTPWGQSFVLRLTPS